MSQPFSKDYILFRQRILSCSGVYQRKLDGIWGQFTDDADKKFLEECGEIADELRHFDPRSESNIRTLRLDAQRMCRKSLAAIRDSGLDARVISGTRTYAEQTLLYAQGRNGKKGPRVTNARAGQSWHNFGLAWDIGIFRGGDYLADGKDYDTAGGLGKIAGVEWGGDWHSIIDKPHFQCPFGAASIAEARGMFEAGGRG